MQDYLSRFVDAIAFNIPNFVTALVIFIAALLLKIKSSFASQGFEIPLPTQTVFVQSRS